MFAVIADLFEGVGNVSGGEVFAVGEVDIFTDLEVDISTVISHLIFFSKIRGDAAVFFHHQDRIEDQVGQISQHIAGSGRPLGKVVRCG